MERSFDTCLRLSRKDGRDPIQGNLSVHRYRSSAAGVKSQKSYYTLGRGSLKEAERVGNRVNHFLSVSSLLQLFALEGHPLSEVAYLVAMSRSFGIRKN